VSGPGDKKPSNRGKNANKPGASHSFFSGPKLRIKTLAVLSQGQHLAPLSPDNGEYCESEIFLAQIKNLDFFGLFGKNASGLSGQTPVAASSARQGISFRGAGFDVSANCGRILYIVTQILLKWILKTVDFSGLIQEFREN
jgi:hypothetical protein